jgi:hypothetical protein
VTISLRGDIPDQIEDLKLPTKVEAAGGFVHEQHLWPLHQRLGDRDHLVLSTAQLVYGPGSKVFKSQIRQNIKGQRQIHLRDPSRERERKRERERCLPRRTGGDP